MAAALTKERETVAWDGKLVMVEVGGLGLEIWRDFSRGLADVHTLNCTWRCTPHLAGMNKAIIIEGEKYRKQDKSSSM
jgi:hypothetical protein